MQVNNTQFITNHITHKPCFTFFCSNFNFVFAQTHNGNTLFYLAIILHLLVANDCFCFVSACNKHTLIYLENTSISCI